MTIERIERVRRLDKEATPGPWNEHHMCGTCAGKGTYWPRCYQCDDSTDDHICPGEQECPIKRGPDSLLIAAYREDAPALATEVKRLRSMLERVTQHLSDATDLIEEGGCIEADEDDIAAERALIEEARHVL